MSTVKTKTAPKKFALIPLSKARNAFALLEDVCKDILAVPARVRMDVVAYLKEERGSDWVIRDRRFPACGAVGCAAGWVAFERGVVARGTQAAERILGRGLHYNTVCEDSELAGLKGAGGALWDWEGRRASETYVFNNGAGDDCERTSLGTRAHARAVVARLKRFMAINEVKLKARKLAPVTKRVRG